MSRRGRWTGGIGVAVLVLAGLGAGAAGPAVAADEPDRGVLLFRSRVQPLLKQHCAACHSHDAKKSRGGLVVDSRAALVAGGDSGPALVPGKADASLLVRAVRHAEPAPRMPPRERLGEADVAALAEWIERGAPWPGENTGIARTPGRISDEDRRWWAFQPVRDAPPPNVADPWMRNDIDRFILDRLRKAGLEPAPEAARGTLLRRLSFDLWGLPPTPEEIDRFTADASPDAYERLVDRLLADRRYAERWARTWLDLVRYADSDGYRLDEYRPLAWRYRDWVIEALHQDKPYDRFVQEQLAGDELFPDDSSARVATGYLRHGIYEYNNRDVRGQWEVMLDDVTDTTGDVFLGLGLQCARCHDHKFDPILQKDYYRLRAFFAALRPRDDLPAATAAEQAAHAARSRPWDEKTAALRLQIAALEEPARKKAAEGAIAKFPPDMQAMIRKPAAERSPQETQLAELAYRQVQYEYDHLEKYLQGKAKDKVTALRRQLAELEAGRPPPLPAAFAATDVGPVAPEVLVPRKKGGPVEPGFLSILDEGPAVIVPMPGAPSSTGRRAALARWLTRPDHPLTGRVLVNRLWQGHFGRGLAANASDFGRLGEAPSHPELLDWLAARFAQDGWSLKKLHRRIVTSATYRQGTAHPRLDEARRIDPENRLLWHQAVRRLEAEQIRDALLTVTAMLDPKAGGPGVPAGEPRRTIYTRVMRNTRDPLLDVFDAPYWFTSAASRDATTTPVQSLLLINSPVLVQRARELARRVRQDEPSDEERRLRRAHRLALGREPDSEELAAGLAFLREQAKRVRPTEAASPQAAFVGTKMPARDGQAAVIRPDGPQKGFRVDLRDRAPTGDFTLEAFILVRSVADTAAVRTIAARGSGAAGEPGWVFGVTGQKSRRQPRTLVLQMFGKKSDGTFGEVALFSDHQVPLNRPCYVAVSVRLAGRQPGSATFTLKDLANDDEPARTVRVVHTVTGGLENRQPLSLGCAGGKNPFDGLLDDLRLSSRALEGGELMLGREGMPAPSPATVGQWPFEARPDVFRDAGGHGLDAAPLAAAPVAPADPAEAALADYCHVLLNASEFLYVE